jgi:hypothetical protein
MAGHDRSIPSQLRKAHRHKVSAGGDFTIAIEKLAAEP